MFSNSKIRDLNILKSSTIWKVKNRAKFRLGPDRSTKLA